MNNAKILKVLFFMTLVWPNAGPAPCQPIKGIITESESINRLNYRFYHYPFLQDKLSRIGSLASSIESALQADGVKEYDPDFLDFTASYYETVSALTVAAWASSDHHCVDIVNEIEEDLAAKATAINFNSTYTHYPTTAPNNSTNDVNITNYSAAIPSGPSYKASYRSHNSTANDYQSYGSWSDHSYTRPAPYTGQANYDDEGSKSTVMPKKEVIVRTVKNGVEFPNCEVFYIKALSKQIGKSEYTRVDGLSSPATSILPPGAYYFKARYGGKETMDTKFDVRGKTISMIDLVIE